MVDIKDAETEEITSPAEFLRSLKENFEERWRGSEEPGVLLRRIQSSLRNEILEGTAGQAAVVSETALRKARNKLGSRRGKALDPSGTAAEMLMLLEGAPLRRLESWLTQYANSPDELSPDAWPVSEIAFLLKKRAVCEAPT